MKQLSRQSGEATSSIPPKLAREAWTAAQDVPWRAVGRIGVLLRAMLGRRTECPLGILTYHRVAWPITGLPRPEHNVAPSRFRMQIEGLVSRGFDFWPLSKVLACRDSGEDVPPRTVVITFDDAYESVYTNAWPILRELQVPATVFISTAYLDSDEPFPFDEWGMRFAGQVPRPYYRSLRREQCEEMWDDGLIEIGAHTHTHKDCRGRPDAFFEDLQTSVAIVREMLEVERVPFSFPFGRPQTGHAADDLAEAARRSGVTCGLTTEAVAVDPKSDPFTWGRFTAFSFDSGATLAGKLDGWYSWAPRLLSRLAWR